MTSIKSKTELGGRIATGLLMLEAPEPGSTGIFAGTRLTLFGIVSGLLCAKLLDKL